MIGFALLASVLAVSAPEAWEMDIDRPTLQVNVAADAVRGMKTGKTCRLAKELFSRFGGAHAKNLCSLALEASSGFGYYAYCDASLSYLVQIDLNRCVADELVELRNRRLTGTAVLDAGRNQILFSHLAGSYAYRVGTVLPAAAFQDAALFSKHEFYADADHLYLLNTILPQPVLHRIDLVSLKETRVQFGDMMVIDYAGGRLLIRGTKDGRTFGLYDVTQKRIIQSWRSPAGYRAHFVGDGWVAFWTKPHGKVSGDWVLTNAVTGESVYHGKWKGTKPPSVTWKGKGLYAGKRQILVADKTHPIRSPVQRLLGKKAG
jgi:hypothetical protein